MNRAETVAKIVVERCLSGARMVFRDDQSTSIHDFDLILPDGELAALEVTAAVDQRLEETVAAIQDENRGGSFIPARKCKLDWVVYPTKDARINKLRTNLDDYLAAIETTGLKRFFAFTDAPEYTPVRAIVEKLQIEAGFVTKWKEAGQICISTPGGGGKVTHEEVVSALRQEAFKHDNMRKLGEVGTNLRLLFLYVHSRNYLPWVSLNDCSPPDGGLQLPEEITDVWVAAATRTPGEFVVWRTVGGRWQDSAVVAEN